MSSDPSRPKRPLKQGFRNRIIGESPIVVATGDEQSKMDDTANRNDTVENHSSLIYNRKDPDYHQHHHQKRSWEIQDPIKITKKESEFRVETVATLVRFRSSDDHWNPRKKKRMAPENSPSAEIAGTKLEGLFIVIPMDRKKNPMKTTGEVEVGLPAVVVEEQLKTESTPENYKEKRGFVCWQGLGSRRSRGRGDHHNRSEMKSQEIRASMKEVRAPAEVSQPIPPVLETRRSMRSRKRNQASKREERFLFSLMQNQIEADSLVMNQLVEDLQVLARSKNAQKSLDKAFPGLRFRKSSPLRNISVQMHQTS